MAKRGIAPGFGAEYRVECADEVKRVAWALGEDMRAFYRWSSSGPATPAAFAEAQGVVRFAGAALVDPICFDYIDVNPASLTGAMAALRLAKATRKPLVLTSDNDYPAPADVDHYTAWADNKKVTPQHILSAGEARAAFAFLDDATFKKAMNNTREVAERLSGIKLPRAPLIEVPGDLAALVEAGRAYRLAAGHIAGWNETYQARMERELELIAQKNFQSYFIVVQDLIAWAKERMLVGPARGSSAGSLVCYLLRITEVDPLQHDLLFERFIDITRADLPDIDIDFNDQKRHLCFEYLTDKYGASNVARLGSVSTLKPRSVMAHVGKRLGIPAGATFAVLNVLIEYAIADSRFGCGLEDTLKDTTPGREFIARYPEAELMAELENHASHTGVHAAGVLVSNNPVTEYCTVIDGIAQLDKKDAEYLNLLKIDALGLRTLGVIEDTNCITNQQLYDLKMDDPEVLGVLNAGKFTGVFQFEGAAQRSVSIQIPIKSFKQIDHITALARPGPLGGGAASHYANRANGREEVEYQHPSMEAYLGETLGVVLYQEQVMRIVREIGGFSWEDTTAIRKAMSGRRGKEFFDLRLAKFAEGAATHGVSLEAAKEIWNGICYFGAWGMNKSHTTSYAVISYWCAYMKRYHPLEYAASCLRNAKDDEQTMELLRELRDEGVPWVAFDPELSEMNWAAKDGRLVGGFSNLAGIGPIKAQFYVEKRAAGGLTPTDLAKLAKHKPKIVDLSPAHTMWAHIYADPLGNNVRGRISEFAHLKDGDNAAVICKLIEKDRRDHNEAVLIAKRNGEVKTGQTQFLDLFVVDDSISKPTRLRIAARDWHRLGIPIADKAVDNVDWFLVRGKWLGNFNMMSVEKIRCLTNPEMLT